MKISKLRKKMNEEDIDSFLAIQNARYFSDTPTSAALIVTEERNILLCGRLDLDRTKKESDIEEIRAYTNLDTPLREGEKIILGEFSEAISEILNELEAKKVGFDSLGDRTLNKIKESHQAEYKKESDLVKELRITKTKEEIKRIKKAGKIATKGMRKAEELIEPGITEIELAAEIEYEMRKLGSEGTAFDTIIASGETSWYPHTEATDNEIGESGLVTIDLGARWKGYKSDMTRTFTISPTEKQEKIMQVTQNAKKRAQNQLKDGIKAKKVEETAREVFREEGYEKYYLHSLGHGVGLNTHEPPRISTSSDEILRKNMVITIEPGLYIRDQGGCRIEDTILVKEEGYKKLTGI